MKVFQVYSRKRDTNGNPYRLMVVYDGLTGLPLEAYEARDSMPVKRSQLISSMAELPHLDLTPTEYKRMKKLMSINRVKIESVY